MNVAQAIAERLAELGVTHCFGIVGGGNIHLWQACSRRLKVISCHHEQAACMAATAYWRTSARLAPVIVTTGAGSTNALTGVMAAWMDSIPLLVLSGNEASYHVKQNLRVRGVQGYASTHVAEHMTKLARPIFQARKAIKYLDEAIDAAITPRQGPVWLDVPKDIQNEVG